MTLLALPGVTADEQPEPCSAWTFTARGVVVGAHPYEIETGYALFSAPAVRRVASPVPVGHGMVSPGPDYLGEQEIVIPVAITAANETEALAAMAALAADWTPAVEPIDATVTTPLGAFLIAGKPDPLAVDDLETVSSGLIRGTLRWFVTDPTLRAAAAESVTLRMGSSVTPSGVGFQHPMPYGFDPGSGNTNVSWAYNSGNFAAPWVAVISGETAPVVNPGIELADTGELLRCLMTVPLGNWLIIDQAARAVWLSADPDDLSGAADRSSTVDYPSNADWWTLPPGGGRVRLQAASGDAAATFTWHSTYLL